MLNCSLDDVLDVLTAGAEKNKLMARGGGRRSRYTAQLDSHGNDEFALWYSCVFSSLNFLLQLLAIISQQNLVCGPHHTRHQATTRFFNDNKNKR